MTMIEKHILKCYYFCNKLHYQGNKNIFQKIIKLVLSKYYSFLLKYLFGSFIPYNAKIGNNADFIHSFHGIFISQSAQIGDNCKFLHHVTIGSNIQKGNHTEAPIIGNNVFIGAGAKIIGKTVIGNNCKIGAGCIIVNKNILDNSIVYVDNIVIKEYEK